MLNIFLFIDSLAVLGNSCGSVNTGQENAIQSSLNSNSLEPENFTELKTNSIKDFQKSVLN